MWKRGCWDSEFNGWLLLTQLVGGRVGTQIQGFQISGPSFSEENLAHTVSFLFLSLVPEVLNSENFMKISGQQVVLRLSLESSTPLYFMSFTICHPMQNGLRLGEAWGHGSSDGGKDLKSSLTDFLRRAAQRAFSVKLGTHRHTAQAEARVVR